MRYLAVILWLILGFVYYWIWNNNDNACCDASGISTSETIAPGEYDESVVKKLDADGKVAIDQNTKSDEEDEAALAAKNEADDAAALAAKKKADEAAEKAIAEAAKTKTVTSVKSTDASGAKKLTFYFPYNSSESILSSGTESDLSEIVASAKASGKKVTVSGHTDDRGASDSNKTLGQWRADEVKKKLIAKGLPGSQVTARSFGEEQPIATNNTSDGRQKNRRVELIIE